MYCSSCGASVGQGLSYCNNCGAKLSGAKSVDAAKPAELFSDSLVWAIVSVFIVGLGGIIGLMALMKNELHFDTSLIVAFSMMSFLLMCAIEGVLIWHLLSRKRNTLAPGDAGEIKGRETKELGAAHGRALSEPVPSVIEHTTRTLEPLYSERKSQ